MIKPRFERYSMVCLVCAMINGCIVFYNDFCHPGDMPRILNTLLALTCVALVYVGVRLDKVSRSNE